MKLEVLSSGFRLAFLCPNNTWCVCSTPRGFRATSALLGFFTVRQLRFMPCKRKLPELELDVVLREDDALASH